MSNTTIIIITDKTNSLKEYFHSFCEGYFMKKKTYLHEDTSTSVTVSLIE